MIKIPENNKKIAELIIEELKKGDKAIFELSANIGKTEASIRNIINKNLKPKEMVSEVGFKQNPNTNSTRGYKIYHLNKEKLGENGLALDYLKQLKNLMESKMDFSEDVEEEDIEFLEKLEKVINNA